jgi:hypothetical protein
MLDLKVKSRCRFAYMSKNRKRESLGKSIGGSVALKSRKCGEIAEDTCQQLLCQKKAVSRLTASFRSSELSAHRGDAG